MENLSVSDPPPLGASEAQQHGPPAPSPVPQLPPQMFTTAAQLLDLTDSKDSRFVDSLKTDRDPIVGNQKS
jgi:U6 snRNA-associated Sm-like protein LSm1